MKPTQPTQVIRLVPVATSNVVPFPPQRKRRRSSPFARSMSMERKLTVLRLVPVIGTCS